MFNIEFTSGVPERQEEDWLGLAGRITLGGHHETFIVPLVPWSRTDYERHWLAAARRLLLESDRTAFFTALYQFWWVMWREGDRVIAHEELLVPDRFAGPYDGTVPFELIGEREQTSDDGQAISEWILTIADLRDFVARTQGSLSLPNER